jgi:hypothetical protein
VEIGEREKNGVKWKGRGREAVRELEGTEEEKGAGRGGGKGEGKGKEEGKEEMWEGKREESGKGKG